MTPFLSQFVLSLTSHNSTSQNIRGTDAWAVPHLKFWGSVPQSPPKSPPMVLTLLSRMRKCIMVKVGGARNEE